MNSHKLNDQWEKNIGLIGRRVITDHTEVTVRQSTSHFRRVNETKFNGCANILMLCMGSNEKILLLCENRNEHQEQGNKIY